MNIKFHENVYKWKCPHINRIVLISEDADTGQDVGSVIAEQYRHATPLIYALNVAESARRKGVASALLSAAEAWLKEQGYTSVMIEWSPQESPEWVGEWYKRRGYKLLSYTQSEYTEYGLAKRL